MNFKDKAVLLIESASGISTSTAEKIYDKLNETGCLMPPETQENLLRAQMRIQNESEDVMIINEGEAPLIGAQAEAYDPVAANEARRHDFSVWIQKRLPWRELTFSA